MLLHSNAVLVLFLFKKKFELKNNNKTLKCDKKKRKKAENARFFKWCLMTPKSITG